MVVRISPWSGRISSAISSIWYSLGMWASQTENEKSLEAEMRELASVKHHDSNLLYPIFCSMIPKPIRIDAFLFPCTHLWNVLALEWTWTLSGQTFERPWQLDISYASHMRQYSIWNVRLNLKMQPMIRTFCHEESGRWQAAWDDHATGRQHHWFDLFILHSSPPRKMTHAEGSEGSEGPAPGCRGLPCEWQKTGDDEHCRVNTIPFSPSLPCFGMFLALLFRALT